MEEKRETLTVKEPARMQAQTGVECKLPVQMQQTGRILQVAARALPLGVEALSGEAQYLGRVLFSVVYADAEGNVKKCECGVEFRGKTEEKSVTPRSELSLFLAVENVRFRTAGETVYLSAVVTAEITALIPREYSCLISAKGAVCKQETLTFSAATAICKGEMELTDEWEDAAVSDVLSYCVDAIVERAEPSVGLVAVEGKARFDLLMKGEGIFCVEKTVPFRVEIDAPTAMPNQTANLSASVGNVHFDVVSDPEKNTSKTEVTYTLLFSGELYGEISCVAVTDAFSTDRELKVERTTAAYLPCGNWRMESSRTAGRTPLLTGVDENAKVLGVLPLSARGEAVKANGSAQIEGVVSAALFYAEGGAVKSAECDFPVTVPLKSELLPEADDSPAPCRLFLERLTADFVESEQVAFTAQVTAQVAAFSQGEISFVSRVEEGEAKPPQKSAIRICFARAGDDLWTLSKSLGVAPETILATNAELAFPLAEEERVVLYNRKIQNYED